MHKHSTRFAVLGSHFLAMIYFSLLLAIAFESKSCNRHNTRRVNTTSLNRRHTRVTTLKVLDTVPPPTATDAAKRSERDPEHLSAAWKFAVDHPLGSVMMTLTYVVHPPEAYLFFVVAVVVVVVVVVLVVVVVCCIVVVGC